MKFGRRFLQWLLAFFSIAALTFSAISVTPAYAAGADDFVITVKTDNPGTSTTTEFTIPTTGTGYDYNVDCNNDGTDEATAQTGNYTCDYGATGLNTGAGTYTVRIKDNTGLKTGFPRIYFNNSGDRRKLLTIEQWGTGKWTSMQNAFYGCMYLAGQATDSPDLSGVTSMSNMFNFAIAFNGNIGAWNTASVTDMSNMFTAASAFNQDIGAWNTASVTTMYNMFNGASAFNKNIGNWDVGNVTNMSYMFIFASAFNQNIGAWNTGSVTRMDKMFYNATAFNQNIGNWNTASVTDMNSMFNSANAFNQNIGNWNTASVTNMSGMFDSASAFNQNIGNWDVSQVTNMSRMFFNTGVFNQPIGAWDVSNVTDMSSIFNSASAFNQPIGTWNTASVTNMSHMFYNASAFNQPIGTWNTASVTDMSNMFYNASAFNQDIHLWNTASVIEMSYMFYNASAFNQNIGTWDVSQVNDMVSMFASASAFNQNIGSWDVSQVYDMGSMFQNASAFNQNIGAWNVGVLMDASQMFMGVTLSTANYDALLNGWNTQTLPSAVTFDGGNSQYCAGEAARTNMTTTNIWSITDGGKDSACFTVTFDANGGSGSMSPQKAAAATNLTSNTFTRTGYAFNGWNTNADGVSGTDYADGASYPFTADVTLYARWITYTVTFNANGGSGSMSPQSNATATALTSNTFTRTGYAFNGWNTNADGVSGTDYADGASYPFTADVTLYARWNDVISPTIVSITRVDPSPTAKTSIQFLVTFSETVTGVSTADFSLTTTGITGSSITDVSGSGATRTVTVSTSSGSGTIRLNIPNNGSLPNTVDIYDTAGNSISSGLPFISGEVYTVNKTLTFNSTGSEDGWVLESTATSSLGGTLNATATTFWLGDDATKKQYRGILSFKTGGTGGIPSGATITGVILRVKKQTIVGGGNPVTAFQGFLVDIKKGFFGTSALQASDFQSAASKTYGPFTPALTGGWYNIPLTAGQASINRLTVSGGLTQMRLRFKLGDNGNAVANYLSLFSGNAPAASRPQLVITYSVP